MPVDDDPRAGEDVVHVESPRLAVVRPPQRRVGPQVLDTVSPDVEAHRVGHFLEEHRALGVHVFESTHEHRVVPLGRGGQALQHRRLEADPEVLAVDPHGSEALNVMRERREDEVTSFEVAPLGQRHGDLADDEPYRRSQTPDQSRFAPRKVVEEQDIRLHRADLGDQQWREKLPSLNAPAQVRDAAHQATHARGRAELHAVLPRPRRLKDLVVGHDIMRLVAESSQVE